MFVCEVGIYASVGECRFDSGRLASYFRCVRDHDTGEDLPLPPPTNAPPGSEAKLRVLQWRQEHQFELWNPHDAAVTE